VGEEFWSNIDKIVGNVAALVLVILITAGFATIFIIGDDHHEKFQDSLCNAIAMERQGLGMEERIDLYKACKEKF
jgi:hypothetical protein